MAETKGPSATAQLKEARAEIDRLNEVVTEYQAKEQEATANPVLDQSAKEALRKAVDDFREVEDTPQSADRTGLLAVAGRTLAERVEGIIG